MSEVDRFQDRRRIHKVSEMEQIITRAQGAHPMAKKTTHAGPLPYSVVTAIEPPTIPASLNETGQKLWTGIMSQYDISDAGGRELLVQLCRMADRAERCRRIINNDGELIEGPNGGPPREHPLLKAELGARSFVTRTIARLGLDVEPTRPSPGRPPGRSGAI
jgi:hypothetical protein